jgi:hypothetical protein
MSTGSGSQNNIPLESGWARHIPGNVAVGLARPDHTNEWSVISGLQAGVSWLKLRALSRCGAIAQLGERLHGMQEVAGSIPASSTIFLVLSFG